MQWHQKLTSCSTSARRFWNCSFLGQSHAEKFQNGLAYHEPVVKQRVMCEECQEYFFDDGNKLKHEKFSCAICQDVN